MHSTPNLPCSSVLPLTIYHLSMREEPAAD